jgi:hypothetical protein
MGMILQRRDSIFRGGRRRSMGMEVDPTLADEEQLDEDISILEETPSPRPRIFVTSRRGRTDLQLPHRRGGRTCQVANCSNPATLPRKI